MDFCAETDKLRRIADVVANSGPEISRKGPDDPAAVYARNIADGVDDRDPERVAADNNRVGGFVSAASIHKVETTTGSWDPEAPSNADWTY